jgi:thymidylate synthase
MPHPEYQYLDLIKDIKENGAKKPIFFTPEVHEEYRKKGQEAPYLLSVFGRQHRYDMKDGFPLLTTKQTFYKSILSELIWFLSGSSNIKYLVDKKNPIWDEWAWKAYHKHCLENEPEKDLNQKDFIAKLRELSVDDPFVVKWGDLKYAYGKMWRKWPASDGREIDQLGWVIEGLKDKPYRKSYVVSGWNPDYIYAMASPQNRNEVPPFCHTMYQFQVVDGKLNLGLYQRSADLFLGVPFNIASYATLLLMVAQITGLEPGEFVHSFGDVHIYSNHFEQLDEQVKREPFPFPTLKINPEIKNIDDFKPEDFELINYQHHAPLRGEIANVGGF